MKTIDRDDLFEHVSRYLKAKGVELQEGSYSRAIHKGCQVLADTINLSQQAMDRAKSEIGSTLSQVRQAIHEKTAPRKPPVQPTGPSATPKETAVKAPRPSAANETASRPPRRSAPRRPARKPARKQKPIGS